MSLKVKAKSQAGKVLPAGVHQACLISVYDVGTHHNATFDKDVQRVVLTWEFPGQTITVDGIKKAMRKSKTYTASLSDKANLRKDLEAMKGSAFTKEESKGFPLQSLLGSNCLANISHTQGANGKTSASISALMPLMNDMTPLAPSETPISFDFDSSTSIPDDCPDWIVELIKEAKEYPAWAAARDEEPF